MISESPKPYLKGIIHAVSRKHEAKKAMNLLLGCTITYLHRSIDFLHVLYLSLCSDPESWEVLQFFSVGNRFVTANGRLQCESITKRCCTAQEARFGDECAKFAL